MLNYPLFGLNSAYIHYVMIINLLTCLASGVGVIASIHYGLARRPELERAGGMLLVAALIGLGFFLARSAC